MHPFSPQEREWVAFQEITDKGVLTQVPLGNGCQRCYSIAVDVLDFDTWASFMAAYEKSEQVQDRVRRIDAKMMKTAGATADTKAQSGATSSHAPQASLDSDDEDMPASVGERTEFEVEFALRYRG